MAAIEPKATAALREIAERAVGEIFAALSVPVERDFAGNVTQRSMPGQPPRMEEDILRQNGDFTIHQDAEGFYCRISFNRPKESPDDQVNAAQVLEFGGVNQSGKLVEPRPFMAPALRRISDYADEIAKRHFASD